MSLIMAGRLPKEPNQAFS